jgi:hypothetical protein
MEIEFDDIAVIAWYRIRGVAVSGELMGLSDG